MNKDIARFNRERNEALLKGVEAVREFCRKWNIPFSSNPRVARGAVNKAITAGTDLPMEARARAKRQLLEEGLSSFDDGDVTP